jgi:hypothetical protein
VRLASTWRLQAWRHCLRLLQRSALQQGGVVPHLAPGTGCPARHTRCTHRGLGSLPGHHASLDPLWWHSAVRQGCTAVLMPASDARQCRRDLRLPKIINCGMLLVMCVCSENGIASGAVPRLGHTLHCSQVSAQALAGEHTGWTCKVDMQGGYWERLWADPGGARSGGHGAAWQKASPQQEPAVGSLHTTESPRAGHCCTVGSAH